MSEINYTERKTVRLTSVSIYPGDKILLDWLCEYLGCSSSEVIRSAIRAMAGQLQLIDKRR